jgi:transcriptional regulator with XRE-family HTH domain
VRTILLGELVRRRREEFGLSQRDLAAQVGIDHSYVSDIERGTRFPSIELLPVLATSLGIGLSEFQQAWSAAKASARQALRGVVPFLPREAIETVAAEDRSRVLRKLGKESFDFSRDRESIAQSLCGIGVVYDEHILGAEKVGDVFGAVFRSYRGVSPALVIATMNAKNGRRHYASEETMTFQLLHEVGHCRLHWNSRSAGSFDLTNPEEPFYCSSGARRSPMEFQANAYASAFLLPARILRQVLGERRTLRFDQHSRKLCQQFQVEPWMLRFRLKTMGIRLV